MVPLYHTGRALAITAGCVSTLGALAMLLADPLTTGVWRLDHGLLPIIVFVTIAAGHLTGTALRAGKWLAATGFALIFCFGTCLTIYQSVGSQKAQSGDKAASIDTTNAAITAKKAEIGKAQQRLDMANTMTEREMNGQKCGQRCADWKTRAAEVASHIRTLETELRGLGAPRTARPRAEAAGDLLALFGYDKAKVVALASELEPFALSLLFEITAIVAFSHGFAAQRHAAPSISDRRQTSFATEIVEPSLISGEQPDPTPPKPRRRHLPANVVDFQPAAQRHPVLAAIEKAGGSVASNRELAGLMSVTEGEASKRVGEVRDHLEIERCGKEKRIRLIGASGRLPGGESEAPSKKRA